MFFFCVFVKRKKNIKNSRRFMFTVVFPLFDVSTFRFCQIVFLYVSYVIITRSKTDSEAICEPLYV